MTYRVQLSRAKGYRRPAGTVQVDRATIFGNPFQVGDPGRWWWPRGEGKAGWETDMIYSESIDPAYAVRAFAAWMRNKNNLPSPPTCLTHIGRNRLRTAMHVRRLLIISRLPSLRGHPLGCRCALDQPCHADVLLQLANLQPGCD
jgi:Domain of unknown function (DUF4326)